MNTSQAIDIGITSKCNNCKSKVDESHTSCTNCGFPQNGTNEQKKVYFQKAKAFHKQLESNKRKIYLIVAIVVLFAGFSGLSGFFILISNHLAGIIGIIFGAIMGGLAFWILKKPIPAFTTGIFVFIFFMLLGTLLNPKEYFEFSLTNIFRIIYLGGMINGLFAAKKIKKIEEDLKNI